MKITKKASKGLKREFNIVVSSKEIEEKINDKLSEIAASARIPGFRPGKIPTSILKARVGKEVMGQVIQSSIDEATKKAIQDENLKPVTKPSIEIDKYDEGAICCSVDLLNTDFTKYPKLKEFFLLKR